MRILRFFALPLVFMLGCQIETDYIKDLSFMKEHTEVLELSSPDLPNAKIMIIPAYQGRVMTSTAGEKSYGWINYELIKSGEILPHMNAFGGEERLWLSPEGGQFSIYFKPNDPFDFEHWQTPSAIDSEPFELISVNESEALFQKHIKLKNYSHTEFEIEINRKVKALNKTEIAQILNSLNIDVLNTVAYQSENKLTNLGEDWQKETGTLGLWILGMYTPSDKTTLLAPFKPDTELALTNNYFGEIPADRLIHKDSILLFKGDGKYRSKIGIAPRSAKPIAGAWDAHNQVLTIIKFDLKSKGDYLKSTWELHENPYAGDAFNSYNDGPTDDGTQMGPFIELESNSSSTALKRGESLIHKQSTFHFEGDKLALDKLAKELLGISLGEIEESVK